MIKIDFSKLWFNFQNRNKAPRLKKECSIELQLKLKKMFRHFFEGFDGTEKDSISKYPISIQKFQITKFEIYEFPDGHIEMKIYLCKAGLLIGKNGRTINDLSKYMSKVLDRNIMITAEDSKLWE